MARQQQRSWQYFRLIEVLAPEMTRVEPVRPALPTACHACTLLTQSKAIIGCAYSTVGDSSRKMEFQAIKSALESERCKVQRGTRHYKSMVWQYTSISSTAVYRSLAKYLTTWVRIWWEKYLEIAEQSRAFSPQRVVPSGTIFSRATVHDGEGPVLDGARDCYAGFQELPMHTTYTISFA
jgi:hypothetical protein